MFSDRSCRSENVNPATLCGPSGSVPAAGATSCRERMPFYLAVEGRFGARGSHGPSLQRLARGEHAALKDVAGLVELFRR